MLSRTPFIFTLSLICITATARICRPGSFKKGRSCRRCPPGTFQNEFGQTSCKNCPIGSVTRVSGTTTELLCRRCPEGFTSKPGTGRCIRCPRGQILPLGGCTECARCPAGSAFSRCVCTLCREDQFTPKPNQGDCIDCPPGLRATEDRKSCEDPGCPLGFEFLGDECIECMYRTFRNASFTTCQPCARRTTLLDFTDHEKCEKCPPGTLLSDIFVPTNEQVQSCLDCPPGTTTKGFSKPFCRREGESCPEGLFEDAEGDCDVCDKGFRFDPVAKTCVKCRSDEFSNGGLVTKCEKCLPGQTGTENFCTCPSGTEVRRGRCRPCPAGTASGQSPECFRCSNFQFSARGAIECTDCPAGSLSIESRGRECKPVRCEKGFRLPPSETSFFPDNVCISVRTGCPKGLFFLRDFGGRIFCGDKDGNIVCPKGTVFDKENFCIRCQTGYRVVKTKRGTLTCRECPRSMPVSRGGTTRRCRRCEKGFEPRRDKKKCICPFGKFVNKRGRCRKCPTELRGRMKLPKGCPRI